LVQKSVQEKSALSTEDGKTKPLMVLRARLGMLRAHISIITHQKNIQRMDSLETSAETPIKVQRNFGATHQAKAQGGIIVNQ